MTRDRYYVRTLDEVGARIGRREWINWWTMKWPYGVYFGQPYPSCTSLGIVHSMREARRKIRKHRANNTKRGIVVYEETADGAPVLLDLRIAMPVPNGDEMAGS